MGLRLTEIVVDCHDPAALAAFWSVALGYHIVRSDEDQVEIAPWEQEPADLGEQVRRSPRAPVLVFVAVPEGKVVKNRLHLDVRPHDSMDREVERSVGLGATVQRRVDVEGSFWTIMLDPEGNEFCILRGPEDGWSRQG
jgi:predicted enzyme related to lactoylglutathione lyase